jgi:hypothetical protein
VRANHASAVASRSGSTVPALLLFLAGSATAVLLFCVVLVAWHFISRDPSPAAPIAQVPDTTPEPAPNPGSPTKSAPWWDGLPDGELAETVALLRLDLPDEQALLDALGDKTESVRQAAYTKLIAKLPALIHSPSAKRLLGRFMADCYVFEPADANLAPVRAWLVQQIPEENAEFQAGYKGDDLDRALWSLDVVMTALTHKTIPAERREQLGQALGNVFGLAVHADAPDLKGEAEKLLARRCYRKLATTAATSLDTALALRDVLLKSAPQHLAPTFREKRDVEMAIHGLAGASKLWPEYSALVRECLESKDPAIQLAIVEVYAQADPQLTEKLQPLFARKWLVVEDTKLNQAAKVRAIQKALGVPDPVERLTQLEKMARDALTGTKAPTNKRNATLQEAARLAHASTLACALLRKDIGLAKFDDLVVRLPVIDQGAGKAANAAGNPKQGDPMPAGDPAVGAAPRMLPLIRGALTPGALQQMHAVPLKRGRTYSILMVSPFDNYLYLYDSKGLLLAQDDDSGGGRNALIVFTPPVDHTYRVKASSFGGRQVGPYTITITDGPPVGPLGFFKGRPGFGPPPQFMPGPPPAQPAVPEEPAQTANGAATQIQVDQSDLAGLLDNNPVANRISSFQSIVTKLPADFRPSDLAMRPAQLIARYLLMIRTNSELEEVLPKVAPLAKSRNMLLALADKIDQDADQKATEGVVGTIVSQPLRFGKDDNWILSCRRLLLQKAIELTETSNPAVETADILCNLYKEQAALLGIDSAGLKDMARPSAVLEAMIRHVSTQVSKDSLPNEDKEYLDQVERQLQVAQFVAQNDLEQTAMLQQAWIRILAMHLAQQIPQKATAMRQVPRDLLETDRLSRNILEQLRGGEEKILRLWMLALDLK